MSIIHLGKKSIEIDEDLAHYIEYGNNEIKELHKECDYLRLKIFKLEHRLRLGWVHLLFHPYK